MIPKSQLQPLNLLPEEALKLEFSAGLYRPYKAGSLRRHTNRQRSRQTDCASARRRWTTLDLLTAFQRRHGLGNRTAPLDVTRLRPRHGRPSLKTGPGQFYVAELRQDPPADTVVMGRLLITYEWSDWRNAQFWWIQSVYVAPRWRQQGVYRSMHHTIVDLARSRADVCGIRLYVEGDKCRRQTSL